MRMDICSPNLDIYKGKIAPNYFKNHESLQILRVGLMSGLKLTLSNVTSLPTDILFGLKKKIFSGLIWCIFVKVRGNRLGMCKWSFADVLQNIHGKTPVLESLFNKLGSMKAVVVDSNLLNVLVKNFLLYIS